jgi:hypothetical protein
MPALGRIGKAINLNILQFCLRSGIVEKKFDIKGNEPVMNSRERIVTVDFVRTVSMMSVILLHVTSAYIFVFSKFSLGEISLSFIMNQAVRYCVPFDNLLL